MAIQSFRTADLAAIAAGQWPGRRCPNDLLRVTQRKLVMLEAAVRWTALVRRRRTVWRLDRATAQGSIRSASTTRGPVQPTLSSSTTTRPPETEDDPWPPLLPRCIRAKF